MKWSSLVWTLPAIALVAGVIGPWIIILGGWADVDWRDKVPFGLISLVILAVTARYLRGVLLFLRCMLREQRECLHDTGDAFWYISPSLMTFRKADIVHIDLRPRVGRGQTVAVEVRGRPNPLLINAVHFEGGGEAVRHFLEPVAQRRDEAIGPWG